MPDDALVPPLPGQPRRRPAPLMPEPGGGLTEPPIEAYPPWLRAGCISEEDYREDNRSPGGEPGGSARGGPSR